MAAQLLVLSIRADKWFRGTAPREHPDAAVGNALAPRLPTSSDINGQFRLASRPSRRARDVHTPWSARQSEDSRETAKFIQVLVALEFAIIRQRMPTQRVRDFPY